MLAILHSLGMFIVDLFKPPCRLEAENLFLRHQLSSIRSTISISHDLALMKCSSTSSALMCASSTPATSPSRRTVTRSLRQSAISCRAPTDARHLVEIVKPSEEGPDARDARPTSSTCHP